MNNFTYDIRPSSRDFCAHLVKYTPDWSLSFQSQLKDQNWFMGEWNTDPTIISMLVMLDAIKENFSDVPHLWQTLISDKERIIFFFLPLSENGHSDELYIKMNSRGKKLTAFEHLKAEFEDLYEKDSEEARIISHKFDVEWADVFFPYRDQDDIIDNDVMRYFFYISHILCYKQGISKVNNEFVLIKLVYKDSPNARANRKYLEESFDCWFSVLTEYKTIDAFFNKFLSNSAYAKDRVATFKNLEEYHGHQNFFHACIKLYQVNNNFAYSDFLFLYGIVTYLINKTKIDFKISEVDFIERLRILRNLIWNSSSGEIRGDSDVMQSLLAEVETLMLFGMIDKQLPHRFNGFQEDEEIEKQQKSQEINLEVLHKFEDHPLIFGFASGLGYDNLDLVDSFTGELFTANPDYIKIHRAMLAIDDYCQYGSVRYYMGNANRATWTQLLHRSRVRKNFDEKTMPILRTLLRRLSHNESLDDIINGFLSQKESDHHFDWRYYFVKYPEMLRGTDGELTWDDSNHYVCTTLNKHQFNGRHWNPFLNVIFQRLAPVLENEYKKKLLELGNYGENLVIHQPVSSLASTGTGFIYYFKDTNEAWDVAQEEMIDKIDRIEFAVTKIKNLVQKSFQSVN